MAIRLSGLTSGMDTDAIVQELVSAYSLKTQKYEKAQTKLTWKQDIWKNLNTKIYGLYTNVSNLRYSTAYNLRKTTVSDNTKATVTASSNAVTGTQTLNILKTAQASYITGGKVGTNVKFDTKMSELGYTGGNTSFEVRKEDGTTHEIKITRSTTVNDVVAQLKDAGLNASFDENNQRFFVSSKESGATNDFNIYAKGTDYNSNNALIVLGLNTAMTRYKLDADGNETDEVEFTEAGAAKYQAGYYLYQASKDYVGDTPEARMQAYLEEQIAAYKATKGEYNVTKTQADKYQKAINEYDVLLTRRDTREAFDDIRNAIGDDVTIENESLRNLIKRFSDKEVTASDIKSAMGVTDAQASRIANVFNSEANKSKIETVAEYKGYDLFTNEVEGSGGLNEQLANFVENNETCKAIKDSLTTGLNAKRAFDSIKSEIGNIDDAKLEKLIGHFAGKSEAEITVAEINEFAEQEFGSLEGINADVIKASLATSSDDMDSVIAYKGGDLLKLDAVDLYEKLDNFNIETIGDLLIDAQKEMKNISVRMEENAYGYIVEEATDKNANETIDERVTVGIQKAIEEAIVAQKVFDAPESRSGNAHKVEGQDAVIKLNGVEYTSNTNSFSINGITINAQAVTGDGDDKAISITTNIDTQGIYDKIKDFLTEYNNVINEMTKLYNAESASDYEPLTDEEKEAMSDEQIEKWETKIKDSLLRRDSSLNSVMSGMINAMAQTYTVDGVKLSLSSFGISTLGFLNAAENEHYAYHIDGDEDDENTSGKDDKLMKAIQEDPDQILEFMKQLTSGLYKAVDEKMKSTELSSAYKVYNDKEMDKELADYAEMIAKWENKVKDKEDFYYDKFSQMEVALSKLQNQTSSISGLLGQ